MLESLFNKAAGLLQFYQKETSRQVLSSEICKISKNTFFYRRVPVEAFGTKVGVTINNKYQIQLRKSIYYCRNLEPATVDVSKGFMCFPVNVANFFRTHILENISERLLKFSNSAEKLPKGCIS